MNTNRRFTRCLVVYNPKSTNAKQGLMRAKALRRFFAENDWGVLSLANDDGQNADFLQAHASVMGPRTLLCAVGGDGTINWLLNELFTNNKLPQAARLARLLPLWGGNGNDLAHMLNGSASRCDLSKIIEQGSVVAIKPLICRMKGPDSQEVMRLAVSHISFGATALAAHSLNDPAHRTNRLHGLPGGRIVQEMRTVLKALVRSPCFTIEESGETKMIYDRLLLNGSRFSRMDRAPLRLTDDLFYQMTAEHKQFSAFLLRVSELLGSGRSQKVRSTRMNFTTHSPLHVQFDGEVMRIAPQTLVSIELGGEPLYALSTRLKL